MAKISDRLRATMNDLPRNKQTEETVATALSKPRSAPGIALFEHQQLMMANAKLAAMESGKVKLSDLYEVEGRKRTLTETSFAELMANLDKNALLHSIVVQPRPQGGYEIIAGHNRVDAYRKLGREEIEADIREFTDEKAFEAAFYSNLFNSPLSDYEKYSGFKSIKDVTNESQKEMAARAGVSEAQISNLFSFDSFSDAAKDLLKIHPHVIGYNAASKVTKADPVRLVEAINKLIDGSMTESQAVAYALNTAVLTSVQTPVITIRRGKVKFAEIKTKGNLIAIKIKDQSRVEELMVKIEQLIIDASKDNS